MESFRETTIAYLRLFFSLTIKIVDQTKHPTNNVQLYSFSIPQSIIPHDALWTDSHRTMLVVVGILDNDKLQPISL